MLIRPLRIVARRGAFFAIAESWVTITKVSPSSCRAVDGDRGSGLELLLLAYAASATATSASVSDVEGTAVGDRGGGQRAERGLGDVGAVDGTAVDVEVRAALDAALGDLLRTRPSALAAARAVLLELTARELPAGLDDFRVSPPTAPATPFCPATSERQGRPVMKG
jgi:hypothetical protein